ncbi:MAG: hypothetical protein ABI625_24910 [bacterium]
MARALLKPSEGSFGTLLGVDLPPLRVVSHSDVRPLQDPATPMTVDGKQLTTGDLFGIIRTDSLTSYSPQENARSANGWWQSNNVGARARTNLSAAPPPGRIRVLVFGESFGNGSRVPQENAWPNIIDDWHREFEVANFAVDGYSMAQSLLRYKEIRQQLKSDIVLMVFAPEFDLWRDVNMLRQLAYPSWDMPLSPRYALVGNQLTLVRPLYAEPSDLYRKNFDGPTPELQKFLRANDRFYFPDEYEPPHLIEKPILARLVARTVATQRLRKLQAGLMDPQGEALRVSRAMFEAMRDQAKADGATFGLVILPAEHRWWDGTAKSADTDAWQTMASFVCANQPFCVDLLPALRKVPLRDVDRVYDGEHFGPIMNLRVATAVYDALKTQTASARGR